MCRKRFVVFAFVLALLATPAWAADRRELMGSWEGSGYHLQLPGSGGVAPYQWRVSDGQLPPGMKIDEATGLLSADRLETRGTYDFSVTLTDATAKKVNENLRVVVLAPVDTRVPLQIITEAFPSAIKGQSYNVVIATRGGVQPVSCFSSTTLPQGLTIDFKDCRFHGTPTQTGEVAFQLVAQDSNATPARVSKAYQLRVESRPLSWWWIALATVGSIVILFVLWAARESTRCPFCKKTGSKGRSDGTRYCPSCRRAWNVTAVPVSGPNA